MNRHFWSMMSLVVLSLLGSARVEGQTGSDSPKAATSQPEPLALPAMEVVGRRQSGAYHADEASGTKTDLPLREVPQAVRVLSRQTLDDLGAVRVDEALDYVGGVSRQNNFGGLWDNIAIRGLAGDINSGMSLLRNGFSGNRGFNAPRDTANIERIEFLKGPAAALYGTSEPGGTLNMVTKKPLWQWAHALEGYGGSYASYRASLDSTGPLIARSLAYRLNAAIENRGSFRDFVDSERYFVAPALTWQSPWGTRIDYNGEWLRHLAPLDRGVVAIDNQLGPVPRDRFLGEGADGDIVIENQTHQLVVEQDLSSRWLARLGLSYKDGTLKGFSTEPQPTLQPDGRTLRRQRRFRDYYSDDFTLQGEVYGRFDTWMVGHTFLVGMEAYWFELKQFMLRVNPSAAAPYAIDVLRPVYGQAQPIPGPNTDTFERQQSVAFYVQDVLSLGEQWRLLAGLRYDLYEQSLRNRRTGVRTTQSPEALTPRLGLSYLPTPQWTLFANVGKSFRPNSGVSADGRAFSPESGRAVELGVKWESPHRTFGGTLALYDIRKDNVLTADPANTGFSIAAGEVRSRGIDLDVSGQFGPWRINASLSYIDATVEEDNTLQVGSRLLNVPEFNSSLLVVYERVIGRDGRFGLGGGITYSSKRLGESRTEAQVNAGTPAFYLPDYTIVKALAYWRVTSTLRLSLDLDNVFDAPYYTTSFQRTWVTPGAPRTFTAGVQLKF